ncbi:cache domain-containing protein [Roseospira goensis]|uniref:histidine kinase n=1 Tax=Roseospira goensis TaxID=391922 RepID=A0A7W6RYG3_9PROT|nr:signal transduction histidine kinase [Roseospira goensis]
MPRGPEAVARERPGVVRSLSLRLFVAFAAALMTLYAYWGLDLYRTMNAEVRYRAETLMEERRAYIRALVETAVNGAQHQRRTVEARARAVIRERVQSALAVASHIWRTRPHRASDQEAEVMIREALRPLRFNNGRGYFFVLDIATGRAILHAANPALEGTDTRDLRDSTGQPFVQSMLDMVRDQGTGFHTYKWFHPTRAGPNHRKIAYLAHFEPLGWAIAAGDYIADMTADIKAETLAQLRSMHFGEDGYIFAGTWAGVSLLGPAEGRNMWEVTDRHGVKIVQELIAAARGGGGFVEYVRPDIEHGMQPSHKLSYVLPVPEWEWYVGAGVPVDDINAAIAAMRHDTRREALLDLLLGTGLVVLLAAASYLIALDSARRIGGEMAQLEGFLADDGRHPERLDTNAMRLAETTRLAQALKGAATRRDAAEAALERQTRNLEKSTADLERFVYVASHDLREPLRIIASYVGLLRRRYRGRLDADADAFIDYASEGARRMHDMIGDLLTFVRVQRSEEPFVAVPLGRVLDRVLATLAARIEETGAKVSVAPTLPVVHGREPLLVSLMQNLIENALKYRDPERPAKVRVEAAVTDDEAVLSVADNGIGIDPAYHDRIFLFFQRLHPASSYPGTGMGLSLCRSIAESHGGRIWLESEPGVGTTFHVALPLAPADEADHGAPTGPDEASRQS